LYNILQQTNAPAAKVCLQKKNLQLGVGHCCGFTNITRNFNATVYAANNQYLG